MPIIAGRASAAYGAGFGAVTTVPYLGPFGAYDALATVIVPSGGLASLTFAGIPAGYKSIEIRFNCIVGADLNVRFNGDATTTYPYHFMYGAGTTPTSSNDLVNAFGYFGYGGFGGAGSTMAGIATVVDYASATKFKTMKTMSGNDSASTGGGVMFASTLYRSLLPINTITIYSKDAGNLGQHSHFALYGIK